MSEKAKLYNMGINLRIGNHSTLSDISGSWDTYVKNHSDGSVFHLAAWQRLILASFKHQPYFLFAEGPEKNIVGILPLFLVQSRLFGRMLISIPQAAYGGILADNDSIAGILLEKAQEITRREKVEFLELRNFLNPLDKSHLKAKDLYVTFRQELFSDPEKNFLSIPRKTRAECREGIKNGLEFRENEIGIDGFYRIYSRNVRDLGTPVFSKKLFSNGFREFGDNCRIFSVHLKAKPVAAVWTLFYKDEILPYYGGSIREYNRIGVNNFMYWMLMKYGCENGYRIFDFGRSKKGTGSFNFKKRWGMTMTDLPYQYDLVNGQSLPDTSPLNPKFAMAIKLWSRMPLCVANTLGPIISRNFI
ncbi:MAG: FemAB family PEP-CTERM system-associated protein [Acidobacteria bacterium]|nr:FemAB family PEP-CTERM system-associated protein [Acidobacteriota bacterium]